MIKIKWNIISFYVLYKIMSQRKNNENPSRNKSLNCKQQINGNNRYLLFPVFRTLSFPTIFYNSLTPG